MNLTLKRDFGQLAVHLSVAPAKISVATPTAITLTAHATSANGGPLANASVTFTLTVQGLGPITWSGKTDATLPRTAAQILKCFFAPNILRNLIIIK